MSRLNDLRRELDEIAQAMDAVYRARGLCAFLVDHHYQSALNSLSEVHRLCTEALRIMETGFLDEVREHPNV